MSLESFLNTTVGPFVDAYAGYLIIFLGIFVVIVSFKGTRLTIKWFEFYKRLIKSEKGARYLFIAMGIFGLLIILYNLTITRKYSAPLPALFLVSYAPFVVVFFLFILYAKSLAKWGSNIQEKRLKDWKTRGYMWQYLVAGIILTIIGLIQILIK